MNQLNCIGSSNIAQANAAAPKPLSMFTTPMPGAQLDNMVNNGVTPAKLAP
jgi:hypothetical protein